MLFIVCSILFSCFGKWDFMCEYHQCRIWTVRSHIGGSCLWSWKLRRSCEDLDKIMVRLFSPCNIVVVCICYGLICSLVTVHDCATCSLNWSCVSHELPNCQEMVCVIFGYMSICHVSPSIECNLVTHEG